MMAAAIVVNWELLADALVRTLFHSLWQAGLLALMAVVLLRCFGRRPAAFRYNVILWLSTSLLPVSIVTFVTCWQSGTIHSFRSGISVSELTAVDMGGAWQWTMEWLARCWQWSAGHPRLLAAVWAMAASLKWMHLMLQWYYSRRIMTSAWPVDNHWQHTLQQLAGQICPDKIVLLLESAALRVPVVLGYWKPVILLPLGLLNNLETAQVEAILLHELSHIRRNDFLVNLFQCLVETIYWFNPALRWLSAWLRREREYCCDEGVLACSGDRESLIEALIRFREFEIDCNKLTTAFAGPRRQLLDRVQRIIGRHYHAKLSPWILAALLPALLLLFAMPQSPIATTSLVNIHSTSPDTSGMRAIALKKAGMSATGSTGSQYITDRPLHHEQTIRSVSHAPANTNGNKQTPIEQSMPDGEAPSRNDNMDLRAEKQEQFERDQAMQDQQQAKREQEEAMLEQERASRDQERVRRDQEMVQIDQERAAQINRNAARDHQQAEQTRYELKLQHEKAYIDYRERWERLQRSSSRSTREGPDLQ